jgi:GNAT superfamily N-acetyltransferase
VTVRPADRARDNAALCELARRCPQGSVLRFYHHRDDYRERCRLHADAVVLVAEEGGGVAGSVTAARKTVFVAGEACPAAYVFDLMVDPAWRGRGLGRRLLRAVRDACPDARLHYSYVLDDNAVSRRLFESEGFSAHPRRLLYHPVLPRLVRRRPPPGLRPVMGNEAEALDAALRRRHGLVGTSAGHDGLGVLEGSGGRAWAAWRRLEPQVFVGLPWYWAGLSRLVPLLPGPGRPVTTWSLHHLLAEGPRGGAMLRRLVRGLAWLAGRHGADAVVVPLAEGDPTVDEVASLTLTPWGVTPGVTRLFLAGERAAAVRADARPPLPDGKDG